MTINESLVDNLATMAVRPQTVQIRQFILDQVSAHPNDIAAVVVQRFGITRQAVARHLTDLVAVGTLEASGNTTARQYRLRMMDDVRWELSVTPDLDEDVPWREQISPKLAGVPQNVRDACAYGFTEMLNNVIDHSESDRAEIQFRHTAELIEMRIRDFGIGIFRKIKEACRLHDEREAILELAKGKLTTDPQRHSGEGVFFTSRAFDVFEILSGRLHFTHLRPDDDWLVEVDQEPISGTSIRMAIAVKSKFKIKDLFDTYANSLDELTFSRTHVPIRLAQLGTESLLSRSQAKRVLVRFDRFQEVLLDFTGVEFIGQAFADEIFRVFANEHPEIKLVAIHSNPAVLGMIRRALNSPR